MNPLLSVLICSIEGRENSLSNLVTQLVNQIIKGGYQDLVEIRIFKDIAGQNSIGKKRNYLLQSCLGEYECFIDDDDSISDDYIKLTIKALKSKPDCVSLRGVLIENGIKDKEFIHSKEYIMPYTGKEFYYRPPMHINTIKSEYAKMYAFPDKNHGEDMNWALKLNKSGFLKKEAKIEKVIYFYNYTRNK